MNDIPAIRAARLAKLVSLGTPPSWAHPIARLRWKRAVWVTLWECASVLAAEAAMYSIAQAVTSISVTRINPTPMQEVN